MSRCLSLLAILSCLSSPTAAQDVCPLNITLDECERQLLEAAAAAGPAAVAATVQAAQEELQETPTSAAPGGTGIASTLRDFLPLFDGMVVRDSISEDGRTVNLNLNPGINYKPLQFAAKIRKPEVYEALETSLPEDQTTELANELESMLGDSDDVEVTATYRLTRKQSREAFRYDDVFHRLVSTVPLPTTDDLSKVLQIASGHEDFEDLTDLDQVELQTFKDALSHDEWIRMQKLLRTSSEAVADYQSKVRVVLEGSFDPFAEAVNNRSQLFASLSYRERDDIAGPDTLNLKVTYELGLSGLGSLQRALKKGGTDKDKAKQRKVKTQECVLRPDAPLEPTCDGAALAEVIQEWGKAAKENRISFSLEYTDVDSVEVDLPDLGVAFSAENQKSLVISAAWGRQLGKHERAPRIDFQASYEDVSDDPNRRDRGVASLVLSQKIGDNWTLPLGILYANHSRFLEGEDEDVSAHFGIRYNIQENSNGQ